MLQHIFQSNKLVLQGCNPLLPTQACICLVCCLVSCKARRAFLLAVRQGVSFSSLTDKACLSPRLQSQLLLHTQQPKPQHSFKIKTAGSTQCNDDGMPRIHTLATHRCSLYVACHASAISAGCRLCHTTTEKGVKDERVTSRSAFVALQSVKDRQR